MLLQIYVKMNAEPVTQMAVSNATQIESKFQVNVYAMKEVT